MSKFDNGQGRRKTHVKSYIEQYTKNRPKTLAEKEGILIDHANLETNLKNYITIQVMKLQRMNVNQIWEILCLE